MPVATQATVYYRPSCLLQRKAGAENQCLEADGILSGPDPYIASALSWALQKARKTSACMTFCRKIQEGQKACSVSLHGEERAAVISMLLHSEERRRREEERGEERGGGGGGGCCMLADCSCHPSATHLHTLLP